MSNLNWVDNVILIFFLISVLAGLMRGLIKEVISLITWVAAFVIATMFAARLAALFAASHPPSLFAIGISYIVLFIATLIIGSLINRVISGAVESAGISFINRILGALFGLARGFLVVLVVIFIMQLTPLNQETWWQQSQFVNYFQPTVDKINQWVSPSLKELKKQMENKLENLKAQHLNQSNQNQ